VQVLLFWTANIQVCNVESGKQVSSSLDTAIHQICVIAVDAVACSFIARVLSIMIQEDELCFPRDFYATGRLSALRRFISDWRKPYNFACHSYANATPSSLSSRVRASVHQAECYCRVMHGCAGSVQVTQHILDPPDVGQPSCTAEDDRCESRVAAPFCLVTNRVIRRRLCRLDHSGTPGAPREDVDWLKAYFGRTAISQEVADTTPSMG